MKSLSDRYDRRNRKDRRDSDYSDHYNIYLPAREAKPKRSFASKGVGKSCLSEAEGLSNFPKQRDAAVSIL